MSTRELNFINKAIRKHQGFYDYSLVEYLSAKTPATISCPVHGIFKQTPNNHLTGHGCNICSKDKNRKHAKTNAEFIINANKIHGNIYDYSIVNYKNAHSKVDIICKEHGIFKQGSTNHLSGQGCAKCNISKSKSEILWLDSLNIEEKYRQKCLKINGRLYKVDALKENIIYEFLGDYWHGNPKKFSSDLLNKQVKKTYGDLYKSTLERLKLFESIGYKVVYIWEYDFKNQIKVEKLHG
jgi:hypothetical protein